MRLWVLKRHIAYVGKGEMAGIVVRAKTNIDARRVAAEHAGSEGSAIWLQGVESSCEPLSASLACSEDVILRDIRK
jgi:hypothetical protein